MLIRTWNLYHGNTSPSGRRAYLREMVELITADKPDIVCLQEIPAWALKSIGGWSGMQTTTSRAKRPKLGAIPIPASLGKLLTAPHHGLFRSAFTGQGNAILIPNDATILTTKAITLNTNVFCEERGAQLGLTPKMMRWWERERRVCHIVHFEFPNRRRFCVANLHATSYQADLRIADAELLRATSFVERGSTIDEILIVAGDFNITREQSTTITSLLSRPPETRYTQSGPQIDHILIRGAVVTSGRVWPEPEREFEGRLLSDHAPVEVEISLDTTAAAKPAAG